MKFLLKKFSLHLLAISCIPLNLQARVVKANSLMQPWEFKVNLPFSAQLPDSYEPFYIPAQWGVVFWADKNDITSIERNGGLMEYAKIKHPFFKMVVDHSILYYPQKNEFSHENSVLLAYNKTKGGIVKDRDSPPYKVYKRFSAAGHEFFLIETADEPESAHAKYKVLHMALNHGEHVWTVIYLNYPHGHDLVWGNFLTSFESKPSISTAEILPKARPLNPAFKDSVIFHKDVPFAPISEIILPLVEFPPGLPEAQIYEKLNSQPHAQLTFSKNQTITHGGQPFEFDRLLEYTSHKPFEEKLEGNVVSSYAVEWVQYRIFLKKGKVALFRRLHMARGKDRQVNVTKQSINFSGEKDYRYEYDHLLHGYLAQRDRRWCIYSGLPEFYWKACKEFPY